MAGRKTGKTSRSSKTARKGGRPGAKAWDKISTRDPGATLANRDVYESQQLDRGKLEAKQSKKAARLGAGIIGVLVTAAAWILFSCVAFAVTGIGDTLGGVGGGVGGGAGGEAKAYYVEDQRGDGAGGVETCYRPLKEDGTKAFECYDTPQQVPVPAWYADQQKKTKAHTDGTADAGPDKTAGPNTLGRQLGAFWFLKLLLAAGSGLVVALIAGSWFTRRVDAANLMRDTTDINQFENDQHIALPEEIQRKFDWFPDAGAHSGVQVSSMISHMMLHRKGLGSVQVAKRAPKDIVDAKGDLLYFEGEVLDDATGEPIFETLPIIDEEFGEGLFDASGLPKVRSLRKRYDASKIAYNPDGKDRAKLGSSLPRVKPEQHYQTVADLIMGDWDFPDYEVQRPAGAYIVDTAPVNTMVLAITRAGKGQTYIEPMVDMWLREKNSHNMVINDPKGELLVKNYIPAVMRGFDVVQFNLINSMKTDIYNPLGMACDAAREGDATKCAMYVENIADVFFPLDGGEDPVWPNAANNAFKRAAYGLIDYYLEEERELREHAAAVTMDPETLEQRLDDMWGKVTLYNCYQLFVQLTSKKVKNPEAELEKRLKAGEFDDDEESLALAQEEAARQAPFWEGKPEQDMLTLYFNATQALPQNTMRTLVGNAHNALKSMAGAEKMLASVYGIAITAMSFFTDPTISMLTSGKPSQNVDLGGLSFPRRLGVRFSQSYIKRDHLLGLQAVWSAYGDPMFTESLGKEFDHSDIVGREGWARYYFEGRFPADQAWLKLELKNPQTRMLVRTFYFHFKKSYQISLNGRHFVVEPVTGRKQIKNGVIRELKPVRAAGRCDGQILGFQPGDTMYPQSRLEEAGSTHEAVTGEARAITQTMVRYSENPKAVFLVTPPHLMKYAKLILILVKQLVDLNFDKSYMTKSNQKPLYKTRFMLDELGNLQSEGKGISGFETMLSIGLGQEQQFTLILQTLQQLRDVYGESVDKIVQGNTSNIVFLKSTDDSMIEMLEKMSGKRHVSRIDSKSVTQDMDRVVGGRTDGRVTYTMNTREEPLISYNDMAFIPERNSIVFRAGDAPVWNRNETILPMSFRLFQNKISHPGHEYSLQTLPTLSSAQDFDVRMNQPDFVKMMEKRVKQATHSEQAQEAYRQAYGYSEVDVKRLDPDLYSDEVMELITHRMGIEAGADPSAPATIDPDELEISMMFSDEAYLENTELAEEIRKNEALEADRQQMRYAEGTISREMLVHRDGTAKVRSLDIEIAEAYRSALVDLHDDRDHFSVGGAGELRSADGAKVYISQEHSEAHAKALDKLTRQAEDKGSRVFAEDDVDIDADQLRALSTVRVHTAFYQFLASVESWEMLADGRFDRAMAIEMNRH